MKFLCDRCKTRYSIADERVRGKILKIRCKNCSNVITVREGMPEPEPEAPTVAEARRVTRPTDYAPSVTGSSPLQAAFAKEMTSAKSGAPAPSQLEEEWYVSLDGDQQGPFTLPEAQAWVGAKKADDDLFCWCEGFDDWLPVEKVSHFRGLRGGPRRARTPTGPALTVKPAPPPPPPKEPEPKPLFAAALAALEADVAADAAARKDEPRADTVPDRAPAKDTRETPAVAEDKPAAAPSKPFGTSLPPPSRPASTPPPPSSVPAAVTALAPPLPAAAKLPEPARSLPLRSTPATGAPPIRATPATGSPPMRAGARPSQAAALFDQSEEPSDVRDPLEPPAPMFADAAAEPEQDTAALTSSDAYDGDDGEFAIGEVSRVVRLADVAARVAGTGAAASARATQSIKAPASLGRGTAAVPRVAQAELASPLSQAASASLDDHDHAGDSVLMPIATRPQRRSHLPLFAVGGILLAGLIGLVVYLASGDDEEETRRGGGGANIEDLALRTDDPRYPRGTGATPGTGTGTGTASGTSKGTSKGTGGKRGTGTGTSGGTGTASGTTVGTDKGTSTGPRLEDLSPDDVVNVANKMSSGTQRCYGQAQKKDPFLKVKSIGVVISVEPAGNVSSVTLDGQQGTILGNCLQASIQRWKFRKSPTGIDTKITLKFEQVVGP